MPSWDYLDKKKWSKPECHKDWAKVNKLLLKEKTIGSEMRAARMTNVDADIQLLSEHERERQLHKQKIMY